MSSVPRTVVTPEQYLARDRQAEFKSEYSQNPSESLLLTAIDCRLPLAEVYVKVEIGPETAPVERT